MIDPATRTVQRHDESADPTITCTFGKVTGFSSGGARVETRGHPTVQENQIVQLTIHDSNSGGRNPRPLLARVCWVRRTGADKGQVGLAFTPADDAERRRLVELARHAAPGAPRRARRLRHSHRTVWRPDARPATQIA